MNTANTKRHVSIITMSKTSLFIPFDDSEQLHNVEDEDMDEDDDST